MTFTLRDHGVNAGLALCLNSVLNVKALVGTFNQEKALVGAFSVIVKTGCGTDESICVVLNYVLASVG